MLFINQSDYVISYTSELVSRALPEQSKTKMHSNIIIQDRDIIMLFNNFHPAFISLT